MFFKPKPHPMAEALIASIRNHPEKWHEGQYTIHIGNKEQHLATVQLWMANGYEYFKIYKPYEKQLPKYWKKKLWKTIEEWRDLPQSVSDFLDLLKEAEAA